MRIALLLVLGLTQFAPAAEPLKTADWPQFRGPTGQGIAPGRLPTEWGPDKNVVWKTGIPGRGWSSPVVAAGKVFLTTAVPQEGSKDQSLRALAIDAARGTILWDVEVFHQDAKAPRVHNKNSHASPTPVVSGDRLFVHFGHQGTACLDFAGKILWQNRSLKYAPVHGNGGSPIILGSLLVFNADGSDRQSIVALDAKSGELRWQTDRSWKYVKGFSFDTPLAIEVAGRTQLVSAASGGVGGYDAETGKEIWHARYDGYSLVPRPIYAKGLVILSSGYDSPKLFAISPDGNGDVSETHVAWSGLGKAPHNPSPLAVGDELYVVADKGFATCLDVRSGKVHWQERLDGDYSASPTFAAGKVYFTSEAGLTTVVDASTTFHRVAQNDIAERTFASFAADGEALLLRTEKHLYRIAAPR